MIWFEFLLCAGLLTYFAYNLCKEGIIVAEKTHLSEGVIGMFFLAVATSFPEIATGATAVFSLGRIGLGYGDLVGSVMVNLMVLLALDYYQGRGRILLRVSPLNRLTGSFTLIAVSAVLIAAVFRLSGVAVPAFGRIGIESILIPCIYFVYLGIVRRKGYQRREGIYHPGKESFWEIWAKFALFLIIVMLLGMWMAKIGDRIVLVTGLSQTFTGTLLLGFATSFPEIIVSFAALKAASVDMAVGNILGSNLFDICVIPFLDFLSKVPILGMLTVGQLTATALALVLSAVAVVGLSLKRDTTRRIGWDTALIFAIGFGGFVLLYFIR
jgi:cation:H+ antiporter